MGEAFVSWLPYPRLLLFTFSKSLRPKVTGSKETASRINRLFLLRLMKNVPTKMTKTRPKMPAIANTKPDATLFCRNDVLALTGIVGGAGIEDDSTTTVVCVTGSGVKELELLGVE
jgi:hypothetical protein